MSILWRWSSFVKNEYGNSLVVTTLLPQCSPFLMKTFVFQLRRRTLRRSSFKVFFHTCPQPKKKCESRRALERGAGVALEPVHVHCLCQVPSGLCAAGRSGSRHWAHRQRGSVEASVGVRSVAGGHYMLAILKDLEPGIMNSKLIGPFGQCCGQTPCVRTAGGVHTAKRALHRGGRVHRLLACGG